MIADRHNSAFCMYKLLVALGCNRITSPNLDLFVCAFNALCSVLMSVCRIFYLWSVSSLNLVYGATKLRHWIRPLHKTRDTSDLCRPSFRLSRLHSCVYRRVFRWRFDWRRFRLRAPVKRPVQIVIWPIGYNTVRNSKFVKYYSLHNGSILH